MRWYRLKRFTCPSCGRRLAADMDQAERRERVACPGCNAMLQLAPARDEGQKVEPSLGADGETATDLVIRIG